MAAKTDKKLALSTATLTWLAACLSLPAAGQPVPVETRKAFQEALNIQNDGYYLRAADLLAKIKTTADYQGPQLSRAECLALSGDIDTAKKLLATIKVNRSLNTAKLAQVYMYCGDFPSAIKFIKMTGKPARNYAGYYYMSAAVHFHAGLYKECIAQCTQAIDWSGPGGLAPKDIIATERLRINAYIALRQFKQAENLSRQLLARSFDLATLSRLASLLWLSGRKHEAAQLFRQVESRAPDKAALLSSECAWRQAHHLPTAATVSKLARTKVTGDGLALSGIVFASAIGDRDNLRKFASILVAMAPNEPMPYAAAALALQKASEPAQARQCLQAARRICKDSLALTLAEFDMAREKPGSAFTAAELKQVLNLKPKTAEDYAARAYYLKNYAYDDLDSIKVGIADFRQACAQGKSKDYAADLVGRQLALAYQRKTLAPGIKLARELVTISQQPGSYVTAGQCLDHLGVTDEARKYFLRALCLEPESYFAALALGRLYLNEQNPAQACRYLSMAVDIDPVYPDAHRFAAEAYYLAGDKARLKRELDALAAKGQALSMLQIKEQAATHSTSPHALAESLLSSGRDDLDARIKALQEQLKTSSPAAKMQLHKMLADLYFLNSQWQQAIAECDIIIAAGQSDYRTYSRKAACYHGWKKPRQAYAIRRQAVEAFARRTQASSL